MILFIHIIVAVKASDDTGNKRKYGYDADTPKIFWLHVLSLNTRPRTTDHATQPDSYHDNAPPDMLIEGHEHACLEGREANPEEHVAEGH
jgi:hypothetical protein